MQDGKAIPGEEAGDWLRKHFADDLEPGITFRWDPDAAPDEGAYERLLAILFTPRPDDPAA